MRSGIKDIDENALRRRAEQRVDGAVLPHSPADLIRLYHELQVHQVELEIQSDELRHANAELQTAIAERQMLYQTLLHELSHPVLALNLFLDVLKGTALTVEQAQLVTQLIRCAGNLGELSRDLSRLGKHDTTAIEEASFVALDPLLERLLDDYAPAAAQRKLALCRIPSCLDVVAAPSLLRRILGNVLANAIRRAESARLLIGVRDIDCNTVRIEVWACDAAATGRDLPPLVDVREARDGMSECSVFEGEGLELLLAHRLAEALGLRVEVRSTAQAGDRVLWVTVPRRPAECL